MKQKLTLAILFMSFVSFFGCACKNAAQTDTSADKLIVNNVNADRFRELLADPAIQLIDVRTAEEYAQGHIANAKLLPVTDSNFKEQADQELDKARPVAIYCRSGGRSAKAADILLRRGYFVYNLLGGYKGYPYK